MSFHFQMDLSPRLTDAGISRFWITTVPAELYIYDDDGVNQTLQQVARCIVESMNDLANGVCVEDADGQEASWAKLGMRCVCQGLAATGLRRQLQRRLEVPRPAVQHGQGCPERGGTGRVVSQLGCFRSATSASRPRALLMRPWGSSTRLMMLLGDLRLAKPFPGG